MIWKKQQTIVSKMMSLMEAVDKSCYLFRRCFENCIENGPTKENRDAAEAVHGAESRVDDILRDIEKELYSRALIPDSRGDVLGILEAFEKIPNLFESISFQMTLQRILIPDKFKEDYLKLLEVNLETYQEIREGVMALFYQRDLSSINDRIDTMESESDRIERGIIERLFQSELDKSDIILLRDIAIHLGDISDRAQSVTDRLNIAIIKRRI